MVGGGVKTTACHFLHLFYNKTTFFWFGVVRIISFFTIYYILYYTKIQFHPCIHKAVYMYKSQQQDIVIHPGELLWGEGYSQVKCRHSAGRCLRPPQPSPSCVQTVSSSSATAARQGWSLPPPGGGQRNSGAGSVRIRTAEVKIH